MALTYTRSLPRVMAHTHACVLRGSNTMTLPSMCHSGHSSWRELVHVGRDLLQVRDSHFSMCGYIYMYIFVTHTSHR